jgi:ribosomal protein S18 acetylase RimI-like enzyme
MTEEIVEVAELEQIRRCAPVLRELRTGLTEAEIVERVQQQMNHGYRLVCITIAESVQSVAGYRVVQNLHNGTFLYVDDLVTRADCKRNGFAGRLFDWLCEEARNQGCSALVLDSGVQRFEAHRFYLKHHMDIAAHHFVRKLPTQAALPPSSELIPSSRIQLPESFDYHECSVPVVYLH